MLLGIREQAGRFTVAGLPEPERVRQDRGHFVDAGFQLEGEQAAKHGHGHAEEQGGDDVHPADDLVVAGPEYAS